MNKTISNFYKIKTTGAFVTNSKKPIVKNIQKGKIELHVVSQIDSIISKICFCSFKASEKNSKSSFTIFLSREILKENFEEAYILRIFSKNMKLLKSMNICSIVKKIRTKDNNFNELKKCYLEILHKKNPQKVFINTCVFCGIILYY